VRTSGTLIVPAIGKGRARWDAKEIQNRFPLPRERQSSPRFDGFYEARDHGIQAEFAADGSLKFAAEKGRWHVEEGIVGVTTRQWNCEGPIGVETLYLVCWHDGTSDRIELEMNFSPR